jgi:biopolymer transport protein TolR
MLQRHKKPRLMADINVVPYIDVMLVLLVIFMVTAPLALNGLPVDLPQAAAQPLKAKNKLFIVTVTSDGSYSLTRGKKLVKNIALSEIISQAVEHNEQHHSGILVRGDKNARYAYIIKLISALHGANVSSIGFVTQQQKSSREGI